MDARDRIERLLDRARADLEVLAVLLFGSVARGESTPTSDVDICLVLTPGPAAKRTVGAKRLSYLADVDLDVQVFQDLPLFMRCRILRDGKVLFCRDEDALYETAFATIRAFERFKRVHDAYLNEVADAGS